MKPKCVNHELCKNHVHQHDHATCITCGSWAPYEYSFQWDELCFRNSFPEEECTVCLEVKPRMMAFPTKCGHWFCIDCSRDLLFWDESKCFLDPLDFGGPRSCMKCPKPSTDCCAAYRQQLKEWKKVREEEYDRWRRMMMMQKKATAYGSCTCPLCRNVFGESPKKASTSMDPQEQVCCLFRILMSWLYYDNDGQRHRRN